MTRCRRRKTVCSGLDPLVFRTHQEEDIGRSHEEEGRQRAVELLTQEDHTGSRWQK